VVGNQLSLGSGAYALAVVSLGRQPLASSTQRGLQNRCMASSSVVGNACILALQGIRKGGACSGYRRRGCQGGIEEMLGRFLQKAGEEAVVKLEG
jgi:hypothetical protein